MGKRFLNASGPWMKEQGVDEKQFDVAVARLFASGSRRSVVWGAEAGALGAAQAVQTPGGNNPVSAPPVSLETCHATCGENCACAYRPAGDIYSGTADNAGACEDCQAGDGCTLGASAAGVYAVGQTTPTRSCCRNQYGVCANLTSCEV